MAACKAVVVLLALLLASQRGVQGRPASMGQVHQPGTDTAVDASAGMMPYDTAGTAASKKLLQIASSDIVGRYYCGSPAVADPYTRTASWTPVNSTTLLAGARGFITPAPISQSDAFQFVYQTSCVGPVVKVAFPVPAPGNYLVTMLLAEPYWTTPGKRVFDVAVEGALLLDDIDVVRTLGSAFMAYNASFVVKTLDKTLSLVLTASVDQAMFSGIIISTAPDLPPPPPGTSSFGVHLYCGSVNFTDATGQKWSPLPTSPYLVNPPGVGVGIQYGGAIAGAGGLLRVFRTECIGSPTVLVPVPSNGWYAITLHTSENYWTTIDKRVFSVLVEGLTELVSYDIFANVGIHTAANKTFYANVTDGDILINLVSIVDQASFGGISIVPYNPVGPTDPALQSPAPASPPVLAQSPSPGPPPASPDPLPSGLVFQMYCGSGTFFDAWGGIWADNTAVQLTSGAGIYGVGATIQGAPIELQRVYQSECALAALTLAIKVPASGEYDVTILNQESYFDTAGSRVFTITAEGAPQVTDLDLWTASGGKYVAYNTSFRIPVTDGTLNLRLAASQDQARFSGIVVQQASSTTPPPAPSSPAASPPPVPASPPVGTPPPPNTGVAMWCGPDDYLDPTSGQLWQSRAFVTGAAYSPVFAGGIAGASAELRPIYAAECVGADYTVAVSGLVADNYTVTILAAETYFTTAATRVFSITIQGVQVLSAVDLYTRFGPVAAGNFTYVVPAVTSTINFRFTGSANQARIGGILVKRGNTAGVPVITPAANPAPAPPAGNPPVNPPIVVPNDTSLAALSINFNGPGFVDARGNQWVPATPYIDNCAGGGSGAISGATADLQPMLTTECFGELTITIPVQVSGTYTLRFWNAEIFWAAANQRLFDVQVNSQRVIQNWDIWKEAGGKLIAQFKEVTVPVSTANIVISLKAVPGADLPTIKGLQLLYVSSSTFAISATPSAYSFQLVDPVDPLNNKQDFTLQTLLPTSISGIRVVQLQPDVYPDQSVFVFTVPSVGTQTTVDTATNSRITYDPPRSYNRGDFISIQGTFLPRSTSFYSARLEILSGVTVIGAITLDGTGDLEANIPHILHVVADGARTLVDVDATNRLRVFFNGGSSHTHDPAHRIIGHQWINTTGGQNTVISSVVNSSAVLPVGSYTWNLTIFDDATPPSTKTDVVAFTIYPPTGVPGTFVKYFSTSAAPTVTSSLTGVAPLAASRMPGFWLVAPVPSRVAAAVVQIQMKGTRTFPAAAALTLTAGPDSHALTTYSILVDGVALAAGSSVTVGRHSIELRAVISTTLDLPLTLKAGDVLLDLTTGVTYDESVEAPVINTIAPVEGIVLGGTKITVQGFAWKMSDVQVLIGTTLIPNSQITQITANSFSFLAPAVDGPSTFPVTITSKGKTSNALPYAYLAADQPVPDFRVTPFQYSGIFRGISCGQWCHGRFFFAGTAGILYEVSFNDDYTVMTNVNRYEQLASNGTIIGKLVLGLACNPHEPSERFKIWLAHSDLFNPAEDPTNPAFKGKSDYTAVIGYFQWPEMNVYNVAVDNLPCATAFHSVASLGFDNKGLLYCGVGAQTNTGAPAPRFGNLAESPWSTGMLRADVMNPLFTGHIKYEFRPDAPAGSVAGKDPDDQRWSVWVRTMRNSTRGLEMYAYGMRNPLGLTFHTNGNLYTCDNGPNADSGAALLSPFNYSTEYVGSAYDRIDLIERFSYHGIGNENRALQGDVREGTYIAREPTDKYYRPSFDEVIDGVQRNYTQPIGLVLSSSNGMDEYRSDAFLGALRGQLVISKLASFLYFVKLSADGRTVVEVKQDSELNLPVVPSLKSITGPYGAIIGIDYDSNTLCVLTPVDTAATLANLTYIYDIFPWRVPRTWPAGQSFPFVLSGANFQNLEKPVTVKFGGIAATNATVTGPNTIKGTIPQSPAAPDALVDIEVVTNSGSSFKILRAFRYLAPYAPVFSGPPVW